MSHKDSLRGLLKRILVAVLLGALGASGLCFDTAKADPNYLARQAVQGVILNIIRTIRDDLQKRTAPPPSKALQFTNDDSTSTRIYDDAFSALAYSGVSVKAPQAAQTTSIQYGMNATATGDNQQSTDQAGVTTVTRSVTTTGSGDITKTGIFSEADALTFLALGSGSWAQADGVASTTDGIAGTVSYLNGGFSTDFTVQNESTKSTIALNGLNTGVATDSVSYAHNIQYKFDLSNAMFIEPTIGWTYTQTRTKIIDSQGGHSTEIQGGVRTGTEVNWNGIQVQATFTATAFSPVSEDPLTIQTGHLGGRAVAKWNVIWSDRFSSSIEVHASAIEGLTSFGSTGALRWSF